MVGFDVVADKGIEFVIDDVGEEGLVCLHYNYWEIPKIEH